MSFFKRLFGGGRREEEETTEVVDEHQTAPVVPMVGGQTRPLPPLEGFRSDSSRLAYGQATDVGRTRATNQDALLILAGVIESTESAPPFGIFIVADGMGGHTDGERASLMAAKTLARRLATDVYLPLLEDGDPSSEQQPIPEVLEEAMQAADREVKSAVPEGGTTLTAAVIHGNLLYVAHVGDSRAYLISDGNLELITRDHSLARRLVEIGHLTAEEAEAYPQKNVLYRAIGQGDALEDVDRATRRLLPGSRLLLCSDGLWGVIGDERTLQIIEETPDVQEACDRLVAAANQAGGPDNITAILVQMPA